MKQSLTHKILSAHLVSHDTLPAPGTEIGLRIDQTLTQDATGTMAYLQFESMQLDDIKTKVSVSYVDHNMLQTGFENGRVTGNIAPPLSQLLVDRQSST